MCLKSHTHLSYLSGPDVDVGVPLLTLPWVRPTEDSFLPQGVTMKAVGSPPEPEGSSSSFVTSKCRSSEPTHFSQVAPQDLCKRPLHYLSPIALGLSNQSAYHCPYC